MVDVDSDKRYNRVLEIIDKRLIPDEEAKKARGEVFTPLNLVREMLYGLRKSAIEKGNIEIWGINPEGNIFDDNESDRVGGIPLHIFRDSTTKWLDPANGMGNFPVVAFYMLDYQISKHGDKKFRGESNKLKRHEHIINNMLYMIEYNKGNINACIKIFKLISPTAKPNILCANTLTMTDEKLKSNFDVNRFNIVMGNPPYNEGGTKTSGEKAFYKKFITYGFNVLLQDGCLVFVHPPNFHRIDKDNLKTKINIKHIFNVNNLIFLRIINDTKDYFDVQISIDYYVLQKQKNKYQALILDKNNILTSNVNISIFNIVPNFGFGIIKKLTELQKKYGRFEAKVGRDSSLDQRRIVIGTFKIIHYINKDGMRVFLSNKKHLYQNTKKVIVNGLGVPYVFNDSEGIYGVSEGPYYVLEPSKKELIFLKSKFFQYLCNSFKIQGNKNDMFLFEIMPNLNKFKYNDIKSMLKSLNMNENDEKEINKYTIPEFPDTEKIEIPGEPKVKKTKTAKVAKSKATKSKKGGFTHKIHHER